MYFTTDFSNCDPQETKLSFDDGSAGKGARAPLRMIISMIETRVYETTTIVADNRSRKIYMRLYG